MLDSKSKGSGFESQFFCCNYTKFKMIILKIKSPLNFKNNKFSKNLLRIKKNSYTTSLIKENKYISILRSPHVFSKFKQRFQSSVVSEIFNFQDDFLNFILLHKLIEEDHVSSLLIIKKYK